MKNPDRIEVFSIPREVALSGKTGDVEGARTLDLRRDRAAL
jgi:hypothetical protein